MIKILLILNAVFFGLDFIAGGIHIGGLAIKDWLLANFALMPWDGLPLGGNVSALDPSGLPLGGYGAVAPFRPWQLITYQFMHGGFWHIFFNMFMLWMFGLELEQRWGSAKFLVFYLLSGIGAGLVHMIMSMTLGHIAPAIGASGAVYGLFFGFISIDPDRRMIIFPIFIPLKAKWIGAGMMAISIFGGLTGGDGIAHFAHIGGGICGFLLAKFGEKTPLFHAVRQTMHFGLPPSEHYHYRRPSRQKQWPKPQPPPQSAASPAVNWEEPAGSRSSGNRSITIGGQAVTQADVDAILDKISAGGYAALTEQEKFILSEISKKM